MGSNGVGITCLSFYPLPPPPPTARNSLYPVTDGRNVRRNQIEATLYKTSILNRGQIKFKSKDLCG